MAPLRKPAVNATSTARNNNGKSSVQFVNATADNGRGSPKEAASSDATQRNTKKEASTAVSGDVKKKIPQGVSQVASKKNEASTAGVSFRVHPCDDDEGLKIPQKVEITKAHGNQSNVKEEALEGGSKGKPAIMSVGQPKGVGLAGVRGILKQVSPTEVLLLLVVLVVLAVPSRRI